MRILFLLVSIICLGWSYAQIPNYEFEEWTAFEIPEIKNWYTYGNVARTTDKSNGDYAMRLENKGGANASYGVIANTEISTNITEGAKYSDRPYIMRFDIKHELASGDTANVLAVFKASGQLIASVDFKVTGSSADTFVRIKFPIQWHISTPPDSLILAATSHTFNQKIYGDGYVVLDNIVFETFGNPDEQVENPDFEEWNIAPIPHPVNWYTTNLFIYDLYNYKENINAVVESSESHFGSSILLQNRKVLDNLIPGFAVSGNTLDTDFPPTFSVSEKWNYIQGYYKYQPENGDTATVAALMYNNGTLIGIGQVKMFSKVDTIKYFSIPITYFLPLSPDSASIVLSSADLEKPKGETTQLWIDKLSFSNRIAGVINSNESLKLFPNPATNYIKLVSPFRADYFIISNALGEEIKVSTKAVINLDEIPKGIYFIKAIIKNKTLTQKFIKQ